MRSAGDTKRLVLAAVLTALALALSLVDSAVSSAIPFLPGAKLGLANIVSLYALYALGLPYALLICVARCVLTALFSGNITMLVFSLAGGLASILVMFVLKRFASIIKASVAGGITHNIMQVGVAALITATPQTVYYLPLLIAAGAISGFLMGLACGLVMESRAIQKYTAQLK